MTPQTLQAGADAAKAPLPPDARLTVRFQPPDARAKAPAEVYDSQGRLVTSHDTLDRIEAIRKGLSGLGIRHMAQGAAPKALLPLLHDLHDPQMLSYLEALSASCPEGVSVFANQFQADRSGAPSTVERTTWSEALQAAGLAIAAAEDLASGAMGDVYALGRPPGHHASRAAFGAYCFVNNAALAALHLERNLGQRPAVLDIDYHAGDGTMDCLVAADGIGFASLHRSTEEAYPYCPELAPVRGGQWMFGLKGQIEATVYLATLETALERLLVQSPGCLVVSIGYDIVEGDPHGGWRLQPSIFRAIAARLKATGLPLLFIQEGGYRTDSLGACSAALVQGLWQGGQADGPR